MDIFAFEMRSKKREVPILTNEKQPMSEDEMTLVDKLEGAKVQRRKRTRIGEKKNSRTQVQTDAPGPSSLPPIIEETILDKGDMEIIPEMEVVNNYQLMFPS